MKLVRLCQWITTAACCLGMLCGAEAATAGRPVHLFRNAEGRQPSKPLLFASDGNLYGTTPKRGPYKNGTPFRITPEGSLASSMPSTCLDPAPS